jgi:hypothetical protein
MVCANKDNNMEKDSLEQGKKKKIIHVLDNYSLNKVTAP